MGHGNSKDEKEVSVDFGRLNPYGNLYPLKNDYDKDALHKFIISRRLSPFYPGVDSIEDFTIKEAQPISQKSSSLSSLKHKKALSAENTSNTSLDELKRDPIECPICFLYYPKNINYTRCCDQPICTDCFLQIKRPETTFDPAECPYCCQPHFGVVYNAFHSSGFKQRYSNDGSTRRKSISHQHPTVVTSDDLRPDWQQRKQDMERKRQLEEQRAALNHARRRQIQVLTEAQLANAAILAANLYERHGENDNRIARELARNARNSTDPSAAYLQGTNTLILAYRYLGADIEELMIMEAMRRSMQETNTADPQEQDLERVLQESAQVNSSEGN
ncbi:SNF1-interacting protein [Boothiomyces sp. JEL0866]|nr:SNF1-interacting protein [Boothiomyces sp. JEL0866]